MKWDYTCSVAVLAEFVLIVGGIVQWGSHSAYINFITGNDNHKELDTHNNQVQWHTKD